MYIESLPHGGFRILIDIPGTCSREGCKYYGYTKNAAIKQFRRDFNVTGQHFIKIEL